MLNVFNIVKGAVDVAKNIVSSVVLVTRSLFDERISPPTKVGVLAALMYVASPIDLLPEWTFGDLALIDDGLVLVAVFDQLINQEDPTVIADLWLGSTSDLLVTQYAVARVAQIINETIGLSQMSGCFEAGAL